MHNHYPSVESSHMSYYHIARITQISNLEIECERYIGSKIAEIAADISGPCRFIGDFGWKSLYRFGCTKSLRLGAVNAIIGAISGLYRGYLEHWSSCGPRGSDADHYRYLSLFHLSEPAGEKQESRVVKASPMPLAWLDAYGQRKIWTINVDLQDWCGDRAVEWQLVSLRILAP